MGKQENLAPLGKDDCGDDFIVVTRHPALVEYLREQGVVGMDVRVIEHASPDDVKGRIVIGILPLHLACLAKEVWEIPLTVPAELRGQELTLEQVRRFANKKIQKYRVFDLATSGEILATIGDCPKGVIYCGT